MKETKVKTIKAFAVIASKLDDFYAYDNRNGEFLAHAVFPTRRKAILFSRLCNSGYGENKPRVIEVLITPLNNKPKNKKIR